MRLTVSLTTYMSLLIQFHFYNFYLNEVLGQKFRKRPEYDNLKLSGLHRDYKQALGISNPASVFQLIFQKNSESQKFKLHCIGLIAYHLRT